MRHLLDTNVISELIARQPDEGVVRWIDGLDSSSTYLSVITIGEVRKGIEKLPDSRRKEALRGWLSDNLLPRFSGRILEIDVGVMLTWGKLTARLESTGKKMPAMDSLIAALALHNDLALVTRKESDFGDTGARIVNPWKQDS